MPAVPAFPARRGGQRARRSLPRLPLVDDTGARDRLRRKVDRRGSRRRSAAAAPAALRFRSLPGALRVRTPIHAPGVAPAAVAPHGVGMAGVALLRVLSGRPAR